MYYLHYQIVFFSQIGFSQYLYIENFNTDDDKGWIHNNSDFSNVDWTMDVTGGSLTAANDWFAVKSDFLEAITIFFQCKVMMIS